MRGGAAGPTAGEPPGTEAEAEEVEESSAGDDEELELGLSLGSKKQQQQQHAPCRILTARDLQPAAALSPDSSVSSSSPAAAAAAGGKRAEGPTATTSPGTVASGHPHSSFGVVGWPPIRQFRMNSLFNQAKENTSETDTKKTATNESDVQKDKEEGEKKGRVAGWVKVNMDGEVIGRKVDLNAHRSYKTLALALELMFTKPSIGLCASHNTNSLKLLDNSAEYQLTYEDRDGDWMLVGDVPWEMFVSSVKRLRIMRTSDANGLGQRYQGIHRTIASTRGRS
uniref:Auxin-responsive protein IAA10 n=1 Tax=Oryza sativa subsp. indica TaxID=39946 RepID=IAA10_ORYSI|nr:RecName: Full=Auxin-responsive protein IAA10; AltName: Full=Indoleacetic acid-induced protein 10 [Oryza sativa Indica Group]